MPLVESSSFRPPWYVRQGDLQTIFPRFFRKIPLISPVRERITTPDGDFLDLDWCRRGSRKLAILTHGLEGSSQSPYIKSTTESLIKRGFDVVSWNFRGCSGVPSVDKRGYHSGKWDDLQLVVNHSVKIESYDQVSLVGFSVGANITLLYLGHCGAEVPSKLVSAAVFNAPVDLGSSARELARPRNKIYMRWFLGLLKAKLLQQGLMEHGTSDLRNFKQLKNFFDFDTRYTAPLFKFNSAEEYWKIASSIHVLDRIRVPSLVVNPVDDPMLGDDCYPVDRCKAHSYVHLEIPRSGGHVGFLQGSPRPEPWLGVRAADFLRSIPS